MGSEAEGSDHLCAAALRERAAAEAEQPGATEIGACLALERMARDGPGGRAPDALADEELATVELVVEESSADGSWTLRPRTPPSLVVRPGDSLRLKSFPTNSGPSRRAEAPRCQGAS